MDNRVLQIQNRSCRVYGTVGAEYLLLQMVDEHDLAGMEREAEAIRRQTARPFLLVAVPVENWNDDLSPWSAPPAWGRQGFGGRAGDTLVWRQLRRPYGFPAGQNTKRRTPSKRSAFTSALATARNTPKTRRWRPWVTTSAPCTAP